MAEDRDALLQHYRQMRDELLAAINGLSDELMTEPSLDGWSVKDHLAHLALWDDIRAGEVARVSAGHDSAWRMTGEQDAAYNELGYALRRDLPLDQVRWELAASRKRLLGAIASATPLTSLPSLALRHILPWSSPPGSKLYEPRWKAKDKQHRVAYVASSGRKFVLLHGFVKKSQRTPRQELHVARARRQDYERRQVK